MSRLTSNDRKFWFITYAKSSWNPIRLVWSSGGGDDEEIGNTLTGYAFGWVARAPVPNVVRPFKIKHSAKTWGAETVARMGRDWYYEVFPREYGFSLNDGFLQLFLGAQTHDSVTTQLWCAHLPWTQWRFVRRSWYGIDGKHFWTEGSEKWEERQRMREAVPKVAFEFSDYDGKTIIATTSIEEFEWKFGEGWFKWLSVFRKPKIRRSLNLEFSEEVGPEKGSWKGGTVGHSIAMLPDELHESAFRRYCAQEQNARHGRTYQLTFIGAVK